MISTSERWILQSQVGIQTWDLSLHFYLNLKHDDLDRPATMAGLLSLLFLKLFTLEHSNEALFLHNNLIWQSYYFKDIPGTVVSV